MDPGTTYCVLFQVRAWTTGPNDFRTGVVTLHICPEPAHRFEVWAYGYDHTARHVATVGNATPANHTWVVRSIDRYSVEADRYWEDQWVHVDEIPSDYYDFSVNTTRAWSWDPPTHRLTIYDWFTEQSFGVWCKSPNYVIWCRSFVVREDDEDEDVVRDEGSGGQTNGGAHRRPVPRGVFAARGVQRAREAHEPSDDERVEGRRGEPDLRAHHLESRPREVRGETEASPRPREGGPLRELGRREARYRGGEGGPNASEEEFFNQPFPPLRPK